MANPIKIIRAPETIKNPTKGKNKYTIVAISRQIITSNTIGIIFRSRFFISILLNFKPLRIIKISEKPSKNHAERLGKREGEISFSFDTWLILFGMRENINQNEIAASVIPTAIFKIGEPAIEVEDSFFSTGTTYLVFSITNFRPSITLPISLVKAAEPT